MVLLIVSISHQVYAIPPAYRQVSHKYNIPVGLLYAIALTESGYQYRAVYNPWPWTLNIEGKAYRFDHPRPMLATLQQAINNQQSVDIGIMQINWRWHKQRFDSPRSALDPHINLKTGAEILVEQYEIAGDWWVAVGRYHAPASNKRAIERASQYRQRVKRHWLRITKKLVTERIDYDEYQ